MGTLRHNLSPVLMSFRIRRAQDAATASNPQPRLQTPPFHRQNSLVVDIHQPRTCITSGHHRSHGMKADTMCHTRHAVCRFKPQRGKCLVLELYCIHTFATIYLVRKASVAHVYPPRTRKCIQIKATTLMVTGKPYRTILQSCRSSQTCESRQ